MEKPPVCSLCGGRLEKHEGVKVQLGGSNVLDYTLAWVCTNCSAAFPIAVGKGGFFRKAEPLYQDGELTN